MDEKREVFEKLLEAYAASLQTLAQAQLQVNHQSAEIEKLKGNFPIAFIFFPIDNSPCADFFVSFSSFHSLSGWPSRSDCRAYC